MIFRATLNYLERAFKRHQSVMIEAEQRKLNINHTIRPNH